MRLLISSPIQLLALLDWMWSPLQQLPMLNLMYYKSGIKIKIWPLWLGVTSGWPLTHNTSGRSQADTYAWVLYSCYVTWTSYITFSGNNLLNHVTPNDPKSKFELVSFVKGLKLVYMHKSCDYTMCIVWGEAFLVKMNFWPLWPQMTQNRDLSQ